MIEGRKGKVILKWKCIRTIFAKVLHLSQNHVQEINIFILIIYLKC